MEQKSKPVKIRPKNVIKRKESAAMAPPVTCYICGRDFGTRSITIHVPQCVKKWEAEQAKLPRSERRPVPREPKNFDRIARGGRQVSQDEIREYNEQAMDDYNRQALSACPNCDRTFVPRALESHLKSCNKPKERAATKTNDRRSPSPSKLPVPTAGKKPIARPGTYVVSSNRSGDDDADAAPSRSDLAEAVEMSAALDEAANRIKLLKFIRRLEDEH